MKSLRNNIRFFLLSTLIASIYNLLSTNKTLAWFAVCNDTSDSISVAFGYLNHRDNRDSEPGNVSHVETLNLNSDGLTGWVAVGWYNLNPGQCNQVYPHELWRRNSYYYVYARSNTKVWQGTYPFCVDPNNGFTLEQSTKGCNGSYLNFRQVNLGGAKIQNYKYHFKP